MISAPKNSNSASIFIYLDFLAGKMFFNSLVWKAGLSCVFLILLILVYSQIDRRAFPIDIQEVKTTMVMPSSTSVPIVEQFSQKRRGCNLVVCSIGNLGNQIWEYMSLFVTWKRFVRYGYTAYTEESMLENLKVFFPNLSIPSDPQLCNAEKQWVINKTEPLLFVENWFKEEECKNIYLDIYSSRHKDILEYGIDRIQEEMRYKPELIDGCQALLHNYKKHHRLENKTVTFVGMHYRGTDYDHHLDIVYGNYKLEKPDYQYYVKAMKHFRDRYENVIFILVTIDYEWLHRNLPEIEKVGIVLVNPNHHTKGFMRTYDLTHERVADLVLLSSCNHSIINYGTFGVTAALFAKGTTFVYDLQLPLDHRGTTLGMSIGNILKNWYVIMP